MTVTLSCDGLKIEIQVNPTAPADIELLNDAMGLLQRYMKASP